MSSRIAGRPTATETIAELYEREHLAMVRLARLIVGSAPLAEEIVHDAFVAVLERGDAVLEPGAYLRRVVINGCHGTTRRFATGRRKMARVAVLEEAKAVTLPPEVDETWQSLQRVTPKQRMALVLRYYADMSIAEVADVMGEREGTIKSLVHRGLTTLRTELTT